jgi:hypothetical protein
MSQKSQSKLRARLLFTFVDLPQATNLGKLSFLEVLHFRLTLHKAANNWCRDASFQFCLISGVKEMKKESSLIRWQTHVGSKSDYISRCQSDWILRGCENK